MARIHSSRQQLNSEAHGRSRPFVASSWVGVGVCVCIMLGATPAFSQPQAPINDAGPMATVRVYLSPFDDSEASLREIEQVVRALPPQLVQLRPTGTISELVVQQFGFGPSNLPRTYALLEKLTLELNNLATPTAAQAGSFRLPSLPSKTKPNETVLANYFPAVSRFEPRGDGTTMARVIDTTRRGALSLSMDLRMPAQELRTGKLAELVGQPFVAIPSFPLKIDFSADDCKLQNVPPVLSTIQATNLRNTLTNDAHRSVPLFVLESGWPSEASQKESLRFLHGMFDRIRKLYNLPQPTRAAIPFEAPTFGHCVQVHQALDEFRALDTAGRIPIVFVPLARAQGADPLLLELMELSDLVQWLTQSFGENRRGKTPPPDIVARARKNAEDTLKDLPKVPGVVVSTDKAIIQAIMTLAAEASGINGAFHVINESWVVEADVIGFAPPGLLRAVVVAAAGNKNENVHTLQRDFSRRGLNDNQYLAAMNMDASGRLVCKSSFVDSGVVSSVPGLGYIGAINGDSGSSFAAPRIAWLLAAAEATRNHDVGPQFWPQQLRERLKRQLPPGQNLPVLMVDPLRLLNLWTTP